MTASSQSRPGLTQTEVPVATGWFWPLVTCFLRFPLLVAGFGCALLILTGRHQAHAPTIAQAFTQFNLTLPVDIVSIVLLAWLLKRENLTFRSIIRPTRKHLLRDLVLCVLVVLPVIVLSAGVNVLGVWLAPHAAYKIVTQSSLINPLGLPWHLLLSTLIIPISAAYTEESLYRGYALPRLISLTGSRWQGIGIMAFGFGVQHIAFALIDWRLALVGFTVAFFAGIAYGIMATMTQQRLIPLMLIHWQSDLLSLGIAPLILYMVLK